MVSAHLEHGGVHLSPDVQGQVEQQEEEVSHRERGQEQGGVVISEALPPVQLESCPPCMQIDDFLWKNLPTHFCQVGGNGYISRDSNLKNDIYFLLSETAGTWSRNSLFVFEITIL